MRRDQDVRELARLYLVLAKLHSRKEAVAWLQVTCPHQHLRFQVYDLAYEVVTGRKRIKVTQHGAV